MHTLAESRTVAPSRTRMMAYLNRHRLFIYAALLLLAAALAVADRRSASSLVASVAPATSAGTPASAPPVEDDRPLVLPDR